VLKTEIDEIEAARPMGQPTGKKRKPAMRRTK
jgi:hypothetical protein